MLVNTFWDSVQRNAESSKYTKNLIFEKNIYLDECMDNDENRNVNVLIIGLNPYNRMKVYGRIESRTECGGVLQLDGVSLMDLLDRINCRFSENAFSNRGYNNYDNDETKISIEWINENRFKITVNNENIKLNLDTLLILKRKYSIIKLQMMSLECVNYKAQLYDFLNHFCYEVDERIVNQALHGSHNINKQFVIYEMCMLSCECFEQSFVLEIANNCLDWFVACVPLFIKALNEMQVQ